MHVELHSGAVFNRFLFSVLFSMLLIFAAGCCVVWHRTKAKIWSTKIWK